MHQAWKAERVRLVAGKIMECVRLSLSSTLNDENRRLRAVLAADAEIQEFARNHPHLYKMLTNPQMINDARFIQAFETLLKIRTDVEAGCISECAADAKATTTIMSTLCGNNG